MVHRFRSAVRFRASLGASAFVVFASAFGAQTGVDEGAQDLEEVVVTAERREMNLQDVPISATVLTAEMLAVKGVDNVIEIQTVAPSLAINTYNRSTFINIRGVGIAQSAPTSNPGVAYYVDGMFIPHEQFIAQIFYDIESIEVLRGPQGTLTGQNSTGGAIYVRTPAPNVDGISGYIDQTVGRYGLVSHDCGRQYPRGPEVRPSAFGRVRRARKFHATTSGRAQATRAAAAILRDVPHSASCRPSR